MIILRLLLLTLPLTSAVIITCTLQMRNWDKLGNIYSCDLASNPAITARNTSISSATGTHKESLANSNVQGFYSESATQVINYLPLGLNTVFTNLSLICIRSGPIQDIRQSDLRQYTDLQWLDLDNNQIVTLEKDLFEFNPRLMGLRLYNNKVKEVYPRIFDHLSDLSTLEMRGNSCYNNHATDRAGVMTSIAAILTGCMPSTLSVVLHMYQLEDVIAASSAGVETMTNETNERTDNLASQVSDVKLKLARESERNLNLTSAVNELKLKLAQEHEESSKLETQVNDLERNLTHEREGTHNLTSDVNSLRLELTREHENFEAVKSVSNEKFFWLFFSVTVLFTIGLFAAVSIVIAFHLLKREKKVKGDEAKSECIYEEAHLTETSA